MDQVTSKCFIIRIVVRRHNGFGKGIFNSHLRKRSMCIFLSVLSRCGVNVGFSSFFRNLMKPYILGVNDLGIKV